MAADGVDGVVIVGASVGGCAHGTTPGTIPDKQSPY
jgi:coenzyme F420-reducing hydrogenase delta subunit